MTIKKNSPKAVVPSGPWVFGNLSTQYTERLKNENSKYQYL
jgi:hypothetical protein